MFCKNCGQKLVDNAEKCPSCGQETGYVAPAVEQQPEVKKAFCSNCGKEINPDKAFCPYCGVSKVGENNSQASVATTTETQNYASANNNANTNGEQDAPNMGFAVLSFFFPMIGLILWLVWKDQMPLKAKSCGKGALIGVVTNFILSIVIGVIYGILIAMLEMEFSALPFFLL